MIETVLLFIATAVAGLVAFLIIYARWHYGTLEKLGIPVVKPHFILGSDHDGHKVVLQERDLERFKKLGPVFGIYDGRTPRVFVVDPDMIRSIMVKDFDHFYDRNVPEWGHDVFSNLLDFLPGEKWKTVRSGLTPIFSSLRIRNGGKKFSEIVEKYIPEVRKQCAGGGPVKFNMKDIMAPVFVEFTMNNFLSLQVNGDVRENYVFQMVKDAAGDDAEGSFGSVLTNVFPFLLQMLPMLPPEMKNGIEKFLATLEQAVKLRREVKTDGSTGKDFIDIMISMFDNLDSEEYNRLKIDKIAIQAQAFEMFIAGYDSIVGTLTILPYFIAANPEIQDKLLEELDNAEGDNASDLPYMTACVREVIRLSPSFNRLERRCMKDWTYKNEDKGINLTIPEGTSVIIPVWATNRNPNVFTEPDEFRPERYYNKTTEEDSTEQKYSMMSFGEGPRNCPGKRMGIDLVKAGMARMMKEFKFEMRKDTKLELVAGIPLLTRYNPVFVDVLLREGVKNKRN